MTNGRARWVAQGCVAWLLLAAMGCGCASAPASNESGASPPATTATATADGKYDARKEKRGESDGRPAPAATVGSPTGASLPKQPARDSALRTEGERGRFPGSGGQGAPVEAPAAPPGGGVFGGAAASAAPIDMGVIAPQASNLAIDPNGRFATTYRPGGGHLAAFESAVSRGIVPTGERELVSDVGARYASNFAVPSGKALGMQADFERDRLAPSGGATHLRLSLRSTAQKPVERPHVGTLGARCEWIDGGRIDSACSRSRIGAGRQAGPHRRLLARHLLERCSSGCT
ncbi:MAG: hypothetical protein U0165_08650 [Polyangiaceae bacterium]